MRNATPGAIYLKDYQPPAYLVDRVDLHFDLYEDHALVDDGAGVDACIDKVNGAPGNLYTVFKGLFPGIETGEAG